MSGTKLIPSHDWKDTILQRGFLASVLVTLASSPARGTITVLAKLRWLALDLFVWYLHSTASEVAILLISVNKNLNRFVADWTAHAAIAVWNRFVVVRIILTGKTFHIIRSQWRSDRFSQPDGVFCNLLLFLYSIFFCLYFFSSILTTSYDVYDSSSLVVCLTK